MAGVSRVARGVHRPTDLFGGWCVRVAWATVCTSLADRLCAGGRSQPQPDALGPNILCGRSMTPRGLRSAASKRQCALQRT